MVTLYSVLKRFDQRSLIIWTLTYDARQVNQLLLVARVVGVPGIAKKHIIYQIVFSLEIRSYTFTVQIP